MTRVLLVSGVLLSSFNSGRGTDPTPVPFHANGCGLPMLWLCGRGIGHYVGITSL